MSDVLTSTEQLKPAPLESKKKSSSEWLPLLTIVAFFALSALFISPVGNFPLNDDWIYSHAVKHFMETGQIEFVGPNCTSCLAHVLLGAAVCKVVGYSHSALRGLTVIIALLNTLAIYGIARELQIGKKVATFAALVYAANPFFINLAYTWMTDVAAAAFATFYALFVVRGMRRRSPILLCAAGVMLMAGMACRQTNAVYIAANVVMLLYLWGRKQHSWTILLALIVAPLIWYKAVDQIVPISVNHPAAYGWYQNHFNGVVANLLRYPMNGLFDIAVFGGKCVMYMGLVFLPFIAPFAVCLLDLVKPRMRLLGLWFVAATAIVTAAATKLVVHEGKLMPFSQNILRVPLLGSLGIMGVSYPGLNKTSRLAITHVSTVSGILLATLLLGGLQRSVLLAVRGILKPKSILDSGRKDRQIAIKLFLCVCALAAYGLAVAQSSIHDLDRYYLILAAPTMAFLCVIWRWLRIKPVWIVSIPLLAVIALYSICAQQDHMSWNRARWGAAEALEAKGVPSVAIDGGAEYNLAHNPKLYDLRSFGQKRLRDWRWYPVQGEKYIISFSPIPGYEVIEHVPYWSALSFKNKEVLVLKEIPGPTEAPPFKGVPEQSPSD